MTAHSKIGASSAKRWMACAGSVRLSEGIVSKSSEFAKEGTMAHALGEAALTDGLPATASIGQEFNWDDHGEKCSAVVTEEMADAVQVYVDWVNAHVEDGDTLLLEHGFHLNKIHADLFGTSDCVIYKPATKTLICADYKHGRGVPVEIEDNPQLMYYALGALLETGVPATQVVMAIVQPRCPHPDGPIRTKTIDALDLLDFADELKKAALATEDPNAPLNPGSHCHWCPAAAVCPAIAAKAQAVAKEEFRTDLTYDAAKLAETLTWLPILETWCENVRQFAYGEAEHGRCPPGWKLVEKRATRKWRDEKEVVAALENAGLLRARECYEEKFKTVTAIEKMLAKEDRAILNELTIKESSGLALAPESDKRPAVKADAKSEFGSAA